MNLKLGTATTWGINIMVLLSVILGLWLGKRIFIPLVLASLFTAMLWPIVSWMNKKGVPAAGLTLRRTFPWIVGWRGRVRFPWSLACMIVVMGGVIFVLAIAAGFGVAMSKFVIDDGNPDKLKEVYRLLQRKLVRISPVPIAEDSPYFPPNAEDSEVYKNFVAAINNRELLQRLGLESASFLWDAIVITFVLLFLLIEGPMLNRHLVQIFGPSAVVQSKAVSALEDMGNQIRAYLVWRTLINFGLALLLGLIYYLLGLAQPWTWALVTAILFYVPYLGPILAGIGPVADAFISCESAWVAPGLLIFYTVVVIFEGYWIVPVVMGRSMEMNATTVMLACLFWEQVWGMAGLFLAMPLMAVVRSACAHVPDWRPWANLMGTDDEDHQPEEPTRHDTGSSPDFLADTQLMDGSEADSIYKATAERKSRSRQPE
jgi:predicted PurR-regulated permease PerM